MAKIGVIEGFFGPSWSLEGRIAFAELMREFGGDFYIYAPKRDGNLRRFWRNPWSAEYLHELENLVHEFHHRERMIGVGLSPVGISPNNLKKDLEILKHHLKNLNSIGIDLLAVFFDDMPTSPNMLETQARVLEWAERHFPKQIIFCPSYYSLDPKLDKVFGQRPIGYVEGLKTNIPPDVSICWTGPQVISNKITVEHLKLVSNMFGRRPFLWENFFANDGPRNCKFLKLRYFEGRTRRIMNYVEGIGFNLMNQPYLSQLVYLSALFTLKEGTSPEESFQKSCKVLCSPQLAELIFHLRLLFLERGLDSIPSNILSEIKEKLISAIKHNDPGVSSHKRTTSIKIIEEITEWIDGKYIVGDECLTD